MKVLVDPVWCALEQLPDGRWQCVLADCRRVTKKAYEKAPMQQCLLSYVDAPDGGPGTELKAILASLKINPDARCGCKAKIRQMDYWGPARCRQLRSVVIGWMRDAASKSSWAAKWTAAAGAFTTALAWKVDWRDPLPDLVDLAIARADENLAAIKQGAKA